MTAIDECRLIEIEQRFARLEAAVQGLDKIAAGVEDRHRKSMLASSGREWRDHERDVNDVMEARAFAELLTELCRDDLMLMQKTIRGGR